MSYCKLLCSMKLDISTLNLMTQLEEGNLNLDKLCAVILGLTSFTCLHILLLVQTLLYEPPYSDTT